VSDVCGVKRMVYGLLSSYNYTLTKRKLGVIAFFFFVFFVILHFCTDCFVLFFNVVCETSSRIRSNFGGECPVTELMVFSS
jgi:uncharacterized membrane protein